MAKTRSSKEARDRIDHQHADLRNDVGAIHELIARRGGSVDEVRARLSEFRALLESHFREEEHDGFFSEVVRTAPRFQPETERLCQEHVELLRRLDEIRESVEQPAEDERWREALRDAFHDFSKQLMRHEGAENEMLQATYGEDIGAAD